MIPKKDELFKITCWPPQKKQSTRPNLDPNNTSHYNAYFVDTHVVISTLSTGNTKGAFPSIESIKYRILLQR